MASFFKPKAKLWINGRKGWKARLTKELIPVLSEKNGKTIWIHAASLGEFEQARPIISALKKEILNCKIICTFYSPSGYEVRKDYIDADYVTYLPLDTKSNAKFWVKHLQPDLVLWVKYDIWANFLFELEKEKTPTILFSSIFRKEQHYFKWYGGFFKDAINSFNHVFAQNETSVNLLKQHGINNCILAPDTRFDRVWGNVSNVIPNSVFSRFKADEKVLIAGSTWQADEDLLVQFINEQPENSDWKFIIFPHEIDEKAVKKLKSRIKANTVIFSNIKKQELNNYNIVIVDCVGLLSSAYQYADLAFIGGGFGAGIHNILEPAVFDLPIVFGPKYHKFQEAKDLIKQKGAISINNYTEFKAAVKYFEQNDVANKNYIKEHIGGTSLVLEKAKQLLSY